MKKSSFASRRSSIEPVRLLVETPIQNSAAGSQNPRSFIPRPHAKRRSSSENRSTVVPSSMVRSKSTLGITVNVGTPISFPEVTVAYSKISEYFLYTPIDNRGLNKKSLPQSECRTAPKDYRPLDDKHWQMETSRKIEAFLMNENISDKRLKELTVNLFVNICNQLLQRLDPLFNITMANYVEQLPLILKKLGYQLPITKSLMVSVNIPRNWGQVLGILEALIDISDRSQNYYFEEDIMCSKAEKAYTAWLGGMDNAISIYGEELCNELSIKHRHENQYLQNQQRELQERLALAKNTKRKKLSEKKEMLHIKEDLQNKKEELEQLKNIYEHKMTELKKQRNRLTNLQFQKAQCKAELIEIKIKIQNQGVTMDEYKDKINECKEVDANIKQRLEMIKDVENFQNKMTQDLEEQKKIVSEIIKKYSYQLMKHCLEFSEFNEFSIPTFSTLMDPENVAILNEIIIKYKNMTDTKEAYLKEIQENIETKTRYNQEVMKKIESIILKNKLIKKDIENELQERDNLLKKIEENKKIYASETKKMLETLNQPSKLPDCEQLKQKIQELEKQENKVKHKTEKVNQEYKALMLKCDETETNFVKEMNILLNDVSMLHQQYNDKIDKILNE